MKCSVYIATSADGFIARPNGDIDWLHRSEYEDAGTLGLVYDEFIATVDAIVMGRHTFEKVLTFEEWYYEGVEVVVLTSKKVTLPENFTGNVRFASGTPPEIISRLEQEGKQHLYVDGGITIQRFLAVSLIDELTLTVLPILLGKGIPLFGNSGIEHSLELIKVFTAESGVIQKRYRIKPE